MTKTFEQHLRTFMVEYLDFAEGKGNPTGYSQTSGICVELHHYVERAYDAGEIHLYSQTIRGMQDILTAEFIAQGLEEVCPFGSVNYSARARNRTQHECPIRLAFIRNFLSERKDD